MDAELPEAVEQVRAGLRTVFGPNVLIWTGRARRSSLMHTGWFPSASSGKAVTNIINNAIIICVTIFILLAFFTED